MGTLRLQGEPKLLHGFQAFLAEEAKRDHVELQLQYQEAKRPAGGLAMTVPPELIVNVAGGLGTAFAAAVGKGLGEWVWAKLKHWLEQRPDQCRTGRLTIKIEATTEVFDLASLPINPPHVIRAAGGRR